MSRLSDLSMHCQQFLKVAATLGGSFMLEDVARLLDRPSATLLSTLDEAVASGFVVAAEYRFAFPSDFLRHGILESIPANARDALRREAVSLSGRRAQAPGRKLWSSDRTAEPDRSVKGGSGGIVSRAYGVIMGGDAAAGVCIAEEILADPGASPSARTDAEACTMLGYFLLGLEKADRLSKQILRERRDASDDVAALMALMIQSNLLWRAGNLAEGLSLGRAAVRHSENVDPVWRLHFQLALAGKLANLREFDNAESLINDVESGLSGMSAPVWRAAPAAMRSRVLLQSGRIGEARREAEFATAADPSDSVPMLRPLAYSVLSASSFYLGDLPAAVEYLKQMRGDVASRVVLDSVQYVWMEVLIAAKKAGPWAAAQLLSDKHSHLPTQRSLYIEVPSAAAFLVVLARDVGDSNLERIVLETVNSLARENRGFPVIGLTATHANALANSAPAALSLIIVQSPDPLSVALATEELAKLYSQRTPGVERHSMPAHTHGGAQGAGAPHQCWSTLSDMEWRIVFLVSAGMTNRQVARQVHLSPHTVNYHLRKVYRKLGINTRVELAHGAAAYSKAAAVYSVDD